MVGIELSEQEALVLFEFLAREIDDRRGRRLAAALEHPAEYWALNGVHCVLESKLAEPFANNYHQLLAAARDKLLDQCDPERSYGPIGGQD